MVDYRPPPDEATRIHDMLAGTCKLSDRNSNGQAGHRDEEIAYREYELVARHYDGADMRPALSIPQSQRMRNNAAFRPCADAAIKRTLRCRCPWARSAFAVVARHD